MGEHVKLLEKAFSAINLIVYSKGLLVYKELIKTLYSLVTFSLWNLMRITWE